MHFSDVSIAVILAVYYSAFGYVTLFGINSAYILFLHIRNRKRMLESDELVWKTWRRSDAELPFVTVQLPMFNEEYVVERLLAAVARLDYPKDRFEIHVLDHSTDSTTEIARRCAEQYRNQGVQVEVYHRTSRDGFKAGNLLMGLEFARGDLIALFDADFVPAPDFLRRTIPFLDDPAIACVQTRTGHLNRSYSPLTIAQSVALDGTNYVIYAAESWSGLFAPYQGSGGIWRRAAIDDAGSWHTDVLLEDLDISYRAQLKGWKIKVLPQYVCAGELPVSVAAAKLQQFRWAKGGLEIGIKLGPPIFRSDLPLITKFESMYFGCAALLYPVIVFLALCWPVTFWLGDRIIFGRYPVLTGLFVFVSLLGSMAPFLYAQLKIYGDFWRSLVNVTLMLVYAMGISLNNSRATVEVLFGVDRLVERTPKFGIERRSDTAAGKPHGMKGSVQPVVEIIVVCYCLTGLALTSFRSGLPVDPFLLAFSLGLLVVIGQGLAEVLPQRLARGLDRKRILS